MCIEVAANGFEKGEGSHISVFINLMKGDYDDNLKWPIATRKSDLKLLNQLRNRDHHTVTIVYPKEDNEKSMQRVVERDRAELVYAFIPHVDLEFNAAKNCQYLKDNC